MLQTDDIRFAITDASARQEALLGLLYQSDQKALALVSLYFTLALAAGSVAIAGFASESAIPAPLSVGLVVTAALFLAGGNFCFTAMKTQSVGFPGRGPEFWLWAIENESVDFAHAAISYLQELEKTIQVNRENNKYSAYKLRWAKRLGLAAPLCGLLASLTVMIF